MGKVRVITKRKIRIYQSDNDGTLTPVGGYKKGRLVVIDDTPRNFSNSPREVVRVLQLDEPNIFIIRSSNNFEPAPAGFKYAAADGANDNCNVDGFAKEYSMPVSVLPDYTSLKEFYKAAGWSDMVGNPDGTFSYGDYEFQGKPDEYNLDLIFPHDSLSDEKYLNAAAEEGELTIAQISKLSKKGKRKYKQALRISKKSSKAQEKQGDAELNKALAKKIKAGVKSDEAEAGSFSATPPAPVESKILGMSTGMAAAVGGGILLTLVVLGLLLSGGKKKTEAAPTGAPAV